MANIAPGAINDLQKHIDVKFYRYAHLILGLNHYLERLTSLHRNFVQLTAVLYSYREFFIPLILSGSLYERFHFG